MVLKGNYISLFILYIVIYRNLRKENMLKKFADQILNQRKNKYIYDKLLVPQNIELSGDKLKWDLEGKVIKTYPSRNLILEFADLANSGSKQVLAFAKKFGVLGLCKHQLPANHSKTSILTKNKTNSICQPLGEESIKLWFEFARNAQAILRISADLRRHRSTRQEDWLVLLANQEKELPTRVSSERQLIENSINLWLDLAGIKPQFNLEDETLYLAYPDSNSLFAELANQLTMKTGKIEGIVTCSECNRSGLLDELAHYRFRKPRSGTRFYCDDCREEGAPQKHADIMYRERRKQKTKTSK